jgi:Ser-tRNA(Ala) deacylase AlaX
MTVTKVFWQDPYLTEISAKVMTVAGNTITLDRTIFYAFSGGQASDSGTVNGIPVAEAKKFGKEILYTLEQGHNLKVGDEVLVSIDWENRYRIMRLHFAAEIVLELVYQDFGRPEKIGANITADKARIDFNWNGNISAIFPQLLQKAKEIVDADLAITSDFSDQESEKRFWEIKGFAKVPCGGTHVKRTGEIGDLVLKRKSLGSGKERIEIYLHTTS